MGISWSAMRKILEQDNLCENLRGRVQYFSTRYRKSHDAEGRIAIRIDGKEIFRSDFYDWDKKCARMTAQHLSWQEADLYALRAGGFDQFTFYEAFYRYANQSIADSLQDTNPVVRLFAVLDKRTGKRRLETLAAAYRTEPEWLQIFYRLRFDAEKISYCSE